MLKKIHVAVAAKLLGKSTDFVRWGLRKERYPFGIAVSKKGKIWSYHISPVLFAEYTGLSLNQLEAAEKEAGYDDESYDSRLRRSFIN